MMQQLSLYIPGIMGLCFAVVAFFYVRHIAANRPEVVPAPPPADEEAQEDLLPFDDLKTSEEIRAQLRANHQKERAAAH
jgi:hypothetical protein